MSEVIARKCGCCKETIEIDRSNISNVIYYDKKYYHESCFVEMATQKAASKRGKPEQWQDALDNIWELEAETKKMLERFWVKDDLNTWLLEHYNITMIPPRFWQIVADLEVGKYKGQRCKPVNMELLYECWKWGQRKLDEIAANNMANHKGPVNGGDRIRYDLAILLGHINDYIKYQNRVKTEREEQEKIIKSMRAHSTIDYTSLGKQTNHDVDPDMDDMASLLDAIF